MSEAPGFSRRVAHSLREKEGTAFPPTALAVGFHAYVLYERFILFDQANFAVSLGAPA